jgi:hypothetical protein
MSGQDRVLSDATWLRDVYDAQEGARAFRAAHLVDSPARHIDSPAWRDKRDFVVTTARIWLITILALVLGALVTVILEKIGTTYFSSAGSLQTSRSEK